MISASQAIAMLQRRAPAKDGIPYSAPVSMALFRPPCLDQIAASRDGGRPRLSNIEQGGELLQGPSIDMSLEEDNLSARMPVVHPFPMVELGLVAAIETNGAVLSHHAQKEPDLLLADADRTAPPADVASWQGVSQPSPRGSHHLHVFAAQPQFLEELPEHGLFRSLVDLYAALRELPSFLSCTPRPQDFAPMVCQDDADVRPEPVRIDQRGPLLGEPAPSSECPAGMARRSGRDPPERDHRATPLSQEARRSRFIAPMIPFVAPSGQRADEWGSDLPKLALPERSAQSSDSVVFTRNIFKSTAATGLASAGMGTIDAAFYTRRARPDDPRFRWRQPSREGPAGSFGSEYRPSSPDGPALRPSSAATK